METMVIAQTTQGEVMMTIAQAIQTYKDEIIRFANEMNVTKDNANEFFASVTAMMIATGKIKQIK